MRESEKLNKIISDIFLGNKAQFARTIGISPQTLNNWMQRDTISKDGLFAIKEALPKISEDWLLTGEGEMLKGDAPIASTSDISEIPKDYVTYLVPIAAMGGTLSGFEEQGVMARDCERIISPIAGVDLAIPVTGDSMEPEYPNGSQVLVKRIYPDDFIAWGNVYVLDTTNGIIIKVVLRSSDPSCVRCESLNPSGRYQPFDVPKRTIRAMYRVLMCVTLK